MQSMCWQASRGWDGSGTSWSTTLKPTGWYCSLLSRNSNYYFLKLFFVVVCFALRFLRESTTWLPLFRSSHMYTFLSCTFSGPWLIQIVLIFFCCQVGDVQQSASVPRHQLPDLCGRHMWSERRWRYGPHRLSAACRVLFLGPHLVPLVVKESYLVYFNFRMYVYSFERNRFESQKAGIFFFVPQEDPVRLWWLTIVRMVSYRHVFTTLFNL